MEEDSDDERREAAIASTPPLQPNFNPSGITHAQLTKFLELHKKRLQIKARSKIRNKSKGMLNKTSKSCFKNPDAKDVTEEISSKEIDDSSASVLNGSAMKNTLALPKDTATVLVGAKKRQKLHWGLDTKERWERKANM
ncbi:uncharacterized protein LOC131298970 [Rhododendron vialii]|uniref:uncharacterized protein LOC131298970 n=1 Tax=Rhododendron vialii TaxID=182163 RepID=UPI00265EFD52|nr:uncharacterized protein LOC131298970 [Rhododendron vialii]XP_058180466.1 uncharacterized protein LOC131298970 [Rhododendron vialii]